MLRRLPGFSTTLTGGFNYWIKPGRWLSGVSGYVTLFPITHSGASQDVTIRFIGVNGRAGYVFQSVPKPWSLSIMGGVYYVAGIASTVDLGGFVNVMGPQIYPAIRYSRSNGDQVSGYFKFSPLSAGFSLLSMANRELATGVSYTFTRARLSVLGDYSDLSFYFKPDTSGPIEVHSRSLSLGISRLF